MSLRFPIIAAILALFAGSLPSTTADESSGAADTHEEAAASTDATSTRADNACRPAAK